MSGRKRDKEKDQAIATIIQNLDPAKLKTFVAELGADLFPPTWTISDIQPHVIQKAKTKNGTRCPCCGGKVQIYGWSDYYTPAKSLRNLYWLHRRYGFNPLFKLKHFNEDVGGKFAKYRYWGLVETHKPDKKGVRLRYSGMWRLTQRGRQYAENALTIPEFVITLHGKVIAFAGAQRDLKYVFPHDDLTVEVQKTGVEVELLEPIKDYGFAPTPVDIPWTGKAPGEMEL